MAIALCILLVANRLRPIDPPRTGACSGTLMAGCVGKSGRREFVDPLEFPDDSPSDCERAADVPAE
jgi:hypothetical protein